MPLQLLIYSLRQKAFSPAGERLYRLLSFIHLSLPTIYFASLLP